MRAPTVMPWRDFFANHLAADVLTKEIGDPKTAKKILL
jgi:hypothetical protein